MATRTDINEIEHDHHAAGFDRVSCCFVRDDQGEVAFHSLGRGAAEAVCPDALNVPVGTDVLDRSTDAHGRVALSEHRARLRRGQRSWVTFDVRQDAEGFGVLIWSDPALEVGGGIPGFLLVLQHERAAASGTAAELVDGIHLVIARTPTGDVVVESRCDERLSGVADALAIGGVALIEVTAPEDRDDAVHLRHGIGSHVGRFRARTATGVCTFFTHVCERLDEAGLPTIHLVVIDVTDPSGPVPQSPLSARRQRVLDMMVEGATTREIARTMVITEVTVRNHVAVVLAALGAHSRVQAIAEARRRGWV